MVERNEARSQQMVAEELARIVQSELVDMRQRNVAETTERIRLENKLGELQVYIHVLFRLSSPYLLRLLLLLFLLLLLLFFFFFFGVNNTEYIHVRVRVQCRCTCTCTYMYILHVHCTCMLYRWSYLPHVRSWMRSVREC